MATIVPKSMYVIRYKDREMFGCSQYNKPSIVFAFQHQHHALKMCEKITQMRSLHVINHPKRDNEFMHKRSKATVGGALLVDTDLVDTVMVDTTELMLYVGGHNVQVGIIDALKHITPTDTVMYRSIVVEPVLETDSLLESLDNAFNLEFASDSPE